MPQCDPCLHSLHPGLLECRAPPSANTLVRLAADCHFLQPADVCIPTLSSTLHWKSLTLRALRKLAASGAAVGVLLVQPFFLLCPAPLLQNV